MFEGCDDVFINQLVRVLRPQVPSTKHGV